MATTLFEYDYILQAIFSLLPLADIDACSQVSKQWHTSTLYFWLHKYMTKAELPMDKVPKERQLTNGYFRQMYFDRFGRDELLVILLRNYKTTKNVQYLKEIERIAMTTMLSDFMFEAEKLQSESIDNLVDGECFGGIVGCATGQLLFINKSVKQESYKWTALATLYSRTSARRVRIGIEYSQEETRQLPNYTNVHLLAYYEDSTEPEHLCTFVSAAKGGYKRQYASVGPLPINESCLKLIAFLDLKSSPKCLINSIALAIPKIACTLQPYTAPKSRVMDFLHDLLDIENEEKFKEIKEKYVRHKLFRYELQKSDFYQDMACRAHGERKKHEILEKAKKENVSPTFVAMLECTTIFRYEERIGMPPKPQVYGVPAVRIRVQALTFTNETYFQLVLPHRVPIIFHTWMHYEEIGSKSEVYIVIDDKVVLFDPHHDLNSEALDDVAKDLLPVYGKLTSVDVKIFAMLVGDALCEFMYNNSKKKVWQNTICKLPLESPLQNRKLIYQSLKAEAQNMRQEIKWDGNPPAGFTKWVFEKEEKEEKEKEKEQGEEKLNEEGHEKEKGKEKQKEKVTNNRRSCTIN